MTRRLGTRAVRTQRKERPRIIVSLTSYPARIATTSKAIRSMFAQKVLPDLVVCYLSLDQFPHREDDLPASMHEVLGFDVQVRWVEGDLKPHKKYLYAMRDFPHDLVITIDDDLYYRNTLIEDLLASYHRHPHAISASRTHLIMFGNEGNRLPYNSWILEAPVKYPKLVGHPSFRLFATSGAGTLFPPGCLPQETFDEEAIERLCLNADDVWLKVMQLIAQLPVVAATSDQALTYVPDTQESALWRSNMNESEAVNNDTMFARALVEYSERTGRDLAAMLHDDSLDAFL